MRWFTDDCQGGAEPDAEESRFKSSAGILHRALYVAVESPAQTNEKSAARISSLDQAALGGRLYR